MKQVIIQKGIPVVHDVPAPVAMLGMLVVKNLYSVISTGTESVSINFSKKSLLEKVFTEREKMEKGLKMLREKGFKRTYQFVKGLLDFGIEVGYSSCGEVVEIGDGVTGFAVGDLVSCAGAQYAHHAEYIIVPVNLCARVPAGLDPREAASGTIGAIALQGVRQAGLSLGESAVVVGLGLLGQLAVQMLVRSGVTVYGVDLDDARIALARESGIIEGFRADDPDLVKKLLFATGGHGVDATLLYAATSSSALVNTAMSYTRKRGRVVIIGTVGLSFNRSPWYEKEIDVRISTSYGPGRYDESYERGGIDYPYAYVRWTEQRNIEAYLSMLKSGAVSFTKLIQKEFDIDAAPQAYAALAQKPLALVLRYPKHDAGHGLRSVALFPIEKKQGTISLGVVGLGAFALSTHLPNLSGMKDRFALRAFATTQGAKAKQIGLQYEVDYVTTDYRELLKDSKIDAILIATRHDSHAQIVCDALHAGKHVFVEKPLALTESELSSVAEVAEKSGRVLMVGFNRRFSVFVSELSDRTRNRRNPLTILYRVNAGYLPPEHWTQQAEEGGRIVGEACHMVDVFSALIQHPVACVSAYALTNSAAYYSMDNVAATITYTDGSLATLLYTSAGNSGLPKEYIEVYSDGSVYIIDDFREARSFGGNFQFSGFDKGHVRELVAFYDGISAGSFPIPLCDLEDVTRASFAIRDAIRKKSTLPTFLHHMNETAYDF